MSGYYLAALALLAGAFAATLWAYLDARQHAREAEDALTAELEDHERTRERLAVAERDRDDHLHGLTLPLDAHARDIVFDPLGTDLIADEPKLRAVKP
jgi:uncharacterized membrane protein YccC